MVFYRKYRPQTIDELDSEKARETLRAVLSSPDIPHAFLFTGPKGLGKTSTARIVSKIVNCELRTFVPSPSTTISGRVGSGRGIANVELQINPCNTCDACISITNGTNIDVLEIDGASNRGIDEIRDLREKVWLAPSMAKKKVYIIDEVHMLTTEAFNALLKTIEEPPDHVLFIFCTTEQHKVPATIVSRCFHINFTRATNAEIVHSLQRIAKGESITITDEILRMIAQRADGGFRDAAKLLEEVVLVAAGKEITKELIEKEFSIFNFQFSMDELMKQLQNKNAKESLQIVSQSVEQGIDMKYFLQQILEALHELLLQESGLKNQESGIKNYELRIDEIMQLVSLFSKAYGDMKYSVIPQLPLEIAIIQWCMGEIMPAPLLTGFSPQMSGKPTLQSLTQKQQELKVKSILHPVKEEPKKVPENPHEQRSIPAKRDDLTALLENLIYKTKPVNHSVAAVLRGCKIISFTDTEMVIEAAYKFHKERLDEQKTQEVLEKAVKEITGKVVKIGVQLKK